MYEMYETHTVDMSTVQRRPVLHGVRSHGLQSLHIMNGISTMNRWPFHKPLLTAAKGRHGKIPRWVSLVFQGAGCIMLCSIIRRLVWLSVVKLSRERINK
ncbi:hypothetical protein L873DRAFT_861076 [Choiromyces venosus 120613-1]|uniref:Uncharacterized protein n=1 Tax=Choiromyces venosus 120613-1 TaxID=1336337 RepID=A0A3N4JUL4_9PEZI|nr:hypothetical protein L873DRAFT_861076 [Choiromyces venosus 120613-1]